MKINHLATLHGNGFQCAPTLTYTRVNIHAFISYILESTSEKNMTVAEQPLTFTYYIFTFWVNAFFYFSTQKQCTLCKSIVHNSIAMFLPKIFYTLMGFEPGSSGPEANAMSIVPGRQGYIRPLQLHLTTLGTVVRDSYITCTR
jgi:hypothetical protein